MWNPTIRQPGFDLPRQQWSLLNRFHMKQGHCGTCRKKWRLTDTDLCPCGETQTKSHIVEQTEWRLISATLYGRRRCFVTDQLWFMTCIREKEEVNCHIERFNMPRSDILSRPISVNISISIIETRLLNGSTAAQHITNRKVACDERQTMFQTLCLLSFGLLFLFLFLWNSLTVFLVLIHFENFHFSSRSHAFSF